MEGIALDRPIDYRYASLRYFKEGEHHVTRVCREDVLLLVFEGVLRFRENGQDYEIHPGQYHIQLQDSIQDGPFASDAPKYLYVHFHAHWDEGDAILPRSGSFEYGALRELMEELDRLAHSRAACILQIGAFYRILSALYQKSQADTHAARLADFIAKEYAGTISLERLCEEFHFSKNHIISIFKKEFGLSPIAYTNRLRLEKAEHRMEMTSETLEDIALQCGFACYSHFYRLFQRKNGMSPEKWRLRKRTNPV